MTSGFLPSIIMLSILFKCIFGYKCPPSYYRVPFRRPHLKLTFSWYNLYTPICCPPVHQSNANMIRLPNTVLRTLKANIFQFSAEKSLLLVEGRLCHGSPGSISSVYLASHASHVV